jgi:predicted RNase H-like nuclease (RuvC/YqgF family)
MGLTELFNEWIVERGSAKVQEKHIAFFRDQLAAADKKISSLGTEVAYLTSENSNLKATVEQLTKENEILRSKIQEYEQPTENPLNNNLLDEPKVKILKLLYSQDNLQAEQIAPALNGEIQTAKFHLEELKSKGMISDHIYRLPQNRNKILMAWSIGQLGRKYLHENGEV